MKTWRSGWIHGCVNGWMAGWMNRLRNHAYIFSHLPFYLYSILSLWRDDNCHDRRPTWASGWPACDVCMTWVRFSSLPATSGPQETTWTFSAKPTLVGPARTLDLSYFWRYNTWHHHSNNMCVRMKIQVLRFYFHFPFLYWFCVRLLPLTSHMMCVALGTSTSCGGDPGKTLANIINTGFFPASCLPVLFPRPLSFLSLPLIPSHFFISYRFPLGLLFPLVLFALRQNSAEVAASTSTAMPWTALRSQLQFLFRFLWFV